MAAARRGRASHTHDGRRNTLGAGLDRRCSAQPPRPARCESTQATLSMASEPCLDGRGGRPISVRGAGGGRAAASKVRSAGAQAWVRRAAAATSWGSVGRQEQSVRHYCRVVVVRSPPLRALPTPSCRRPESCDHWRRGGGVQKLGQLGRHPWAERGAESRGPRGRLAGEHRGAPAAGWGRFRVTDASPSEAQG